MTTYVSKASEARVRSRIWRENNKEWAKASVDKCWADPARKAKYDEKKKEYAATHAEIARDRARKWHEQFSKEPAVVERKRLYGIRWRNENPDKHCAKEGKRRAYKLQATPAWANDFFIKEAYHLASLRTKLLGFRWHVDHIIPLKSHIVCGLHWERNLQVIPFLDNLSKGNRHWTDMPSIEEG